MKTLTLYLCHWRCALRIKRDLSRPRFDTEHCDCGAAEKNVLILDTRKAATKVSVFNAAEGESYQREQAARAEAVKLFNSLVSRCAEMGIDWKQGEDYLL